MTDRRLLLWVALLALPELIVVAIDHTSELRWLTKPVPMLALIAWLVTERRKKQTRHGLLVLIALSLSLVGDLLLLNSGKSFFLTGLGCFLVAHLFYVVSFWLQRGPGDALVANLPRLAAVFGILALAGWMLFDVMGHDRLKELFGPVAAYVGVIAAMAISALHRLHGVPRLSFRMVMVGALLFMLSDCLLATSLFVSPFALSGLWIMLSYYAAQALITTGYARSF